MDNDSRNSPAPDSDDLTRLSLRNTERSISELERERDTILERLNRPRQELQIPFSDAQTLRVVLAGGQSLQRVAENEIVADIRRRRRRPGTQVAGMVQSAEASGNSRPVRLVVAGIAGLVLLTLLFNLQSSKYVYSEPTKPEQVAEAVNPSPVPAIERPPEDRAPPQPTQAAATATTPPLPSPTAYHLGLSAPGTLTIQVGVVDIKAMPVLRAENQADEGRVKIAPPPVGTVSHLGSYPGEPGNMVLLGRWEGFGEQLQQLQLNDTFAVFNREGIEYRYQVVPCDVSGRLACQPVTGADCPEIGCADVALQLGLSPEQIVSLIAYRGNAANYMIQARRLAEVSPLATLEPSNQKGHSFHGLPRTTQ